VAPGHWRRGADHKAETLVSRRSRLGVGGELEGGGLGGCGLDRVVDVFSVRVGRGHIGYIGKLIRVCNWQVLISDNYPRRYDAGKSTIG